jgi:uncharacterized protein YycO
MENKSVTAVEWLVNEIAEKYNFRFATYYGQEIQQAKEMEKEQIKDAYKFGISDEYVIGADRYYNQTFKK